MVPPVVPCGKPITDVCEQLATRHDIDLHAPTQVELVAGRRSRYAQVPRRKDCRVGVRDARSWGAQIIGTREHEFRVRRSPTQAS